MSERLCECGCGQPLVGLRANARYASDACRSRDWKRRAGYVDPRAAKPRRNVSRRSKPTAPRISYRKALDALTTFLVDQYALRGGVDDQHVSQELRNHCRVTAAGILDPLLPPAARKALTS